MGLEVRTVEQKLAAIARVQHGLATNEQMLAARIADRDIGRRVRDGGLIRKYRGVFRVGHDAPSLEADYLAAVLACGEGSMLSGRAAAFYASLIKGTPPPPEVLAPTERTV